MREADGARGRRGDRSSSNAEDGAAADDDNDDAADVDADSDDDNNRGVSCKAKQRDFSLSFFSQRR